MPWIHECSRVFPLSPNLPIGSHRQQQRVSFLLARSRWVYLKFQRETQANDVKIYKVHTHTCYIGSASCVHLIHLLALTVSKAQRQTGDSGTKKYVCRWHDKCILLTVTGLPKREQMQDISAGPHVRSESAGNLSGLAPGR